MSMPTAADGRDLRRTRSEGAVPSPRSSRVRVAHRPGASVSRTAPTLPPLDLPGELRIPSLQSAAHDGPTRARWEVPLHDDPRRDPTPHPAAGQGEQGNVDQPDGLIGMVLQLLGYAGPNAKARREFLSLVFYLIFGFAQFVIIVTLLAYSAHHESPTMPGKTEWKACERPLGVWNALWLIRVALGCLLAFWGWQRERERRAITRVRRRDDSDVEIATQRYLNGRPHYPRIDDGPTRPPRGQNSGATGLSYEGTSGAMSTEPQSNVPVSRLHARVSMCTSFISLAWFLAAHILAYTSVNTCRFAAPHIWWLTFGILCILYVMILEIFLLGLLVFILGPVLYLVWNIALLCLGRHPLQNPHYINPDIGKLPKSVVQQIPLVLYIPPPPEEPTDGSTPITVPPAAHIYPPKDGEKDTSPVTGPVTPGAPPPPPKRRFAFFRRRRASKKKKPTSPSDAEKGQASADTDAGDDADADVPWDEMWEKSEYPFVRLEGNRAVCAICLMDFEEPRRVRGPGAHGKKAPAPASPAPTTASPVQTGTAEVQVEAVTEEERDALHLNDAGEGAQPLRLLMCGHAFHQTCVDPWLTDVSGRCPTCQRPVEVQKPTKKKKGGRRQRTQPH
ncbi:hypothetical protein C8Q77DRAFT_259319 [Trametes polyzona]|nr:hypothetical protein C8Q77DRAFT_259319 [Trametes polyzona]